MCALGVANADSWWALILIVPLIVVLVWLWARSRTKIDGRKYFPGEDPDENCERLKEWWLAELRHAGVDGDGTVEWDEYDEEPETWSRGKALWKALAEHTTQLGEAYEYVAEISGARWPLEATVLTTEAGLITRVIYATSIGATFPGELVFKKENDVPFILDRFEGEGADRLNANKALRKTMGRSMCFRYEVPRSILSVTVNNIDVHSAACVITPTDEGSEVVFHSTVRTRTTGAYEMTLGLGAVLAALEALEQAGV